MSPSEFRTFLIAYAVVLVLNWIFGRVLPLPEGASRQDLVRIYLSGRARSFIFAFGAVGGCVLLAGLVGFIGLYLFWPPAVVFFMAATIAKIALLPVVPVRNPTSKWEDACSAAELFLAGIIVALTLFGPADSLFRH